MPEVHPRALKTIAVPRKQQPLFLMSSVNPDIKHLVVSPLHRLEQNIAKDLGRADSVRSENYPSRDSIYSFDSVSTNGRLLDRLDLDGDDEYEEDFLRRRESYASIQSTGRLLDRLGLEPEHHIPGNGPTSGGVSARNKPVRTSSSISFDRTRGLNRQIPPQNASFSARLPQKSTPPDVFHDSHSFPVGTPPTPPMMPAPGAPGASGSSESVVSSLSTPTHSPNLLLHRHKSGSTESIISNPNTKFDSALENNIKKALLLRSRGNFREASYQLQLLGNPPYNYPKAMYLYALSLRVGLGVKLNELSSVKWLCRCILVAHIVESADIDAHSLSAYVSKLAAFLPMDLVKMVKKMLMSKTWENDPFDLFRFYHEMGSPAIAKICSNNAKDNNTLAAAYHKLADAVYHGAGVPTKDVLTAIDFYTKAASLGYPESMAMLGELWSVKSKHYKKDYRIAAAWLRLGELFGRKDIGNSWIYKSKYMAKPK